ncbi:MAG: radical SAM protein [bacterium]
MNDDNHTIHFSDNSLKGTFTAAHTEGRLVLCLMCHTGREYRIAFDYGRLSFIRLTTPEMRDRRISQLLLERSFLGEWHLEKEMENIPFQEDFPSFQDLPSLQGFSSCAPSDGSIRQVTDFAYALLQRAYRIVQDLPCQQDQLISHALAFNYKTLEAERHKALNFAFPLILPPFADQRLCFPVMQGCQKLSLYGPCSFCDTFLTRPFRLLSPSQIVLHAQKKIRWLDGRVKSGYELFLTEADALAAPIQSLESIIRFLRREFPGIPRMCAFSSILSINGDGDKIEGKSPAELQRLRQAGLVRIYLGIESGSDQVLLDMNKQATRKEQVLAVRKIQEAGLEVACMIITGYGGRQLYQEHLEGTIEFLSQACPDRVFFSRMTPRPGTLYWSRNYTSLSRSEMDEWEKKVQAKVSNKVIFRPYTQLNT